MVAAFDYLKHGRSFKAADHRLQKIEVAESIPRAGEK
jgi:hypothetical protein